MIRKSITNAVSRIKMAAIFFSMNMDTKLLVLDKSERMRKIFPMINAEKAIVLTSDAV